MWFFSTAVICIEYHWIQSKFAHVKIACRLRPAYLGGLFVCLFFFGWIFPVFHSGFCGLGIPGFCELCLLVGFCCFWLLGFLPLWTIPQPLCRHQLYRKGLKTGQQHCFIRKLAFFWLLWLCHLGPLVSCVFLLLFLVSCSFGFCGFLAVCCNYCADNE